MVNTAGNFRTRNEIETHVPSLHVPILLLLLTELTIRRFYSNRFRLPNYIHTGIIFCVTMNLEISGKL